MTTFIPEAPAHPTPADLTPAEKLTVLGYAVGKLARRVERHGEDFLANGVEDLDEAYLLLAELPDTLDVLYAARPDTTTCRRCGTAIQLADTATPMWVNGDGLLYCPDNLNHHPAAAIAEA
jgi:hypothetical protein